MCHLLTVCPVLDVHFFLSGFCRSRLWEKCATVRGACQAGSWDSWQREALVGALSPMLYLRQSDGKMDNHQCGWFSSDNPRRHSYIMTIIPNQKLGGTVGLNCATGGSERPELKCVSSSLFLAPSKSFRSKSMFHCHEQVEYLQVLAEVVTGKQLGLKHTSQEQVVIVFQ